MSALGSRGPIEAVLLDLYDTLAWSEWPQMRADLERRLGVTEADLIRAFVSTRQARSVGAFGSQEGDLRAVLEAAGVKADETLVRDLTEETERFLGGGVHLWEDSLPALRELRSRGIATAVVSNCDHATRRVVDRLGLPREADSVILSFEVRAAKPDAAIYRAALDAVGVPAARAAFVDDQVTYCDGAAELGMRTFLIMRGETFPLEGGEDGLRHEVIRDLRSLLAVV